MGTKKTKKLKSALLENSRKGLEILERFYKGRKGFRIKGKVLGMQERFCKLVGKGSKLWERFDCVEKGSNFLSNLMKFFKQFL